MSDRPTDAPGESAEPPPSGYPDGDGTSADPALVAAPSGPIEAAVAPSIEPVRISEEASTEQTARADTRSLIGSSAVMATGTVISRVTGVGRDIALTAALGFYLV